MKTAKDLRIPFSWEERRPILLDRFLYLPQKYDHTSLTVPFFEKELPIFIEYCSGNGQWIGDRARQNPQFNWIAVEKRFERARKIWLRIHREHLPNLFVVCGEAREFTRFYAPQAAEIYVNFPDPWPKLRHAKHRLVTHLFLNELLAIVAVNGKVTCVTDDANYAAQMIQEFEKCPDWHLAFQGQQWPDYGRSFFNDLWIQKNRLINYLSYEKKI